MFNIYRNQSNTISVNLSDRSTQENHDWVFVFTNDQDGQSKTFASVDLSDSFERYSEFVIIESSTEDPYNGTIELKPTGFWSYKIYEMPVSSPPSLDINNAYALVKEGRVKVIDSSEIERPTFDTDETKDNITFDE